MTLSAYQDPRGDSSSDSDVASARQKISATTDLSKPVCSVLKLSFPTPSECDIKEFIEEQKSRDKFQGFLTEGYWFLLKGETAVPYVSITVLAGIQTMREDYYKYQTIKGVYVPPGCGDSLSIAEYGPSVKYGEHAILLTTNKRAPPRKSVSSAFISISIGLPIEQVEIRIPLSGNPIPKEMLTAYPHLGDKYPRINPDNPKELIETEETHEQKRQKKRGLMEALAKHEAEEDEKSYNFRKRGDNPNTRQLDIGTPNEVSDEDSDDDTYQEIGHRSKRPQSAVNGDNSVWGTSRTSGIMASRISSDSVDPTKSNDLAGDGGQVTEDEDVDEDDDEDAEDIDPATAAATENFKLDGSRKRKRKNFGPAYKDRQTRVKAYSRVGKKCVNCHRESDRDWRDIKDKKICDSCQHCGKKRDKKM